MNLEEVNQKIWTLQGKIMDKFIELETRGNIKIHGNPLFSKLMKLRSIKNLAPNLWPQMTDLIDAADAVNAREDGHYPAHLALLQHLELFWSNIQNI